MKNGRDSSIRYWSRPDPTQLQRSRMSLTKSVGIPTGLMIAHGMPGLAACEAVITSSIAKRAKDYRSILHKLAI